MAVNFMVFVILFTSNCCVISGKSLEIGNKLRNKRQVPIRQSDNIFNGPEKHGFGVGIFEKFSKSMLTLKMCFLQHYLFCKCMYFEHASLMESNTKFLNSKNMPTPEQYLTQLKPLEFHEKERSAETSQLLPKQEPFNLGRIFPVNFFNNLRGWNVGFEPNGQFHINKQDGFEVFGLPFGERNNVDVGFDKGLRFANQNQYGPVTWGDQINVDWRMISTFGDWIRRLANIGKDNT